MSVLTEAEKAQIQTAVDLMRGNYEKPLDQEIVQLLLPMAEKFGFPTEQAPQTGLAECLRDKPFSTLLTALLNVAA